MSIKVTVVSVGSGACALTGKSESDGLVVAFDSEAPCFLSKKAFWQILSMKAAQDKPKQPEPRPAVPVASPANGPVVAAK